MALDGYSSPEAESVFERAHALCSELEDDSPMFRILRALGAFYCNKGDLVTARTIADQLIQLSHADGRESLIAEALSMRGFVLFFRGEFLASQADLTQTLSLVHPHMTQALAVPYVLDIAVLSLSVIGDISWKLGYPDQALVSTNSAVARANERSHHFSTAYALLWASNLHTRRGEWHLSLQHIDRLIELSQQHGFRNWLAVGFIIKGYTLSKQGDTEIGIALIRQGIDAITRLGAQIDMPYYLVMLSDALLAAGKIDEGLIVIDKALTIVEGTEERNVYSEAYRVKGELLLAAYYKRELENTANDRAASKQESESSEIGQAEFCFRHAIENAQMQSARSLELRAATSLSKLLLARRLKVEAREALSSVFNWFTEGLDTLDLRNAESQLKQTT